MSDNEQSMYALLVGINDYASPTVPDLSGCVNDVEEMGRLLREKFEVPATNIKILKDSEATHEGIKKEFRDHLISRARSWVDAGRQGTPPAFLFHYSGHGSQALDSTGAEPDGLDETIVPHDSRLPGVFDIKDWELGLLLDELNRYAENVTVVLDCCHSGSGVRDVKDSIAPTRRCQPDLRAQPEQRPSTLASTRAVTGPSGWELGEQYVLLAGCRDREEANEHIAPEGRYGALTYFLIKELSQMPPDRPLTYRELHQRVSYRVNDLYKDQMPQCEGDRDRQVFDGLRPVRDMFLSVVDKSQGYVWVDGGLVHGLTAGSELKVYPEGTRTRTEAGPIATLVVDDVSAARSGCHVSDGERDIPIHAPVAVHALNLGDMRRKVVLDMPDRYDLEIQLENRLAASDVADYLVIASPGTHADYRVQLMKDELQVQDNSGALLVAPYALDDLDGVARDLAHLARYKNSLELRNIADSTLADAIKLTVKKLAFAAGDQTPVAETIAPTSGGETIVEAGQQIVVEITNNSATPLNVTLFDFSYDWSITRLYPRIRGSNEQIEPGRTISIGLSREKRDQLRPRLPEEVNEVPQIIKAIASTADIDVSVLEQRALKMPFTKRAVDIEPKTALGKLLNLAMSGGATRALAYDEPEADDQWTTAQLEFRIVQPTSGPQTERALRGGETATLPAYQISLEAPEGFEGQMRVLTARQSTRAVDGDPTDLRPPAGFAGLGHLVEPVLIRPTRAVAPGGAVIEVDADDLSRQKVTGDTPLKIHLPSTMIGKDDVIFALAYDGNAFYPVGRQGNFPNTLYVEWLPEAPPAAQPPLRSVRSLGHTLKLYLYKVLGQADSGTGLCRARFVPQDELTTDLAEPGERIYRAPSGEIRYRPLRDGELQAGQRVALFVHGFGSETAWLVGGPAEYLRINGVHYDHILTFDYEHVNTTIGTNGQALANALKAAGLNSTDNITLDVFAHDMGALVCRSMIEMWGGSDFVDRCLLAGPPNEGTILVRGKKLVPLLGTLITNLTGPNLLSLVFGWALKKITDDAKSLDDLDPDSDFLKQLNSSTSDAKVPYYIMAGRNELPPDGEAFWKRLYLAAAKLSDTALDLFFNDQHDMVLSVHSMSTVREGKYPAELLKVQVLPCHHYAYLSPAYFAEPGHIAPLLEWLA